MASSGLYRSNRHSMIAGVMGGIAERFGWNVTLLRVIFVLISIMSAAFRNFSLSGFMVSDSEKTARTY